MLKCLNTPAREVYILMKKRGEISLTGVFKHPCEYVLYLTVSAYLTVSGFSVHPSGGGVGCIPIFLYSSPPRPPLISPFTSSVPHDPSPSQIGLSTPVDHVSAWTMPEEAEEGGSSTDLSPDSRRTSTSFPSCKK